MQDSTKEHATHVEDATNEPNGLSLHQEAQLSPDEKRTERRLVWKADLIILPLLSLMYFVAAMDRSDVANAAVAGMETELSLTASQYSQCVAFLFIGYVAFQPLGQLFVRQLGPPLQLGAATMGWGLFTALLCLAKNWQTIAGVRVIVGCLEAFIQAGPLYLSIWYKREELATRGAIFFSMMAVAGSMNGIIAYGIELHLNNAQGWLAWRWIFLIEGIVTVGAGLIVILLLPPVPEKIRWFFTEEEKRIAVRRSQQAFNTPGTSFKFSQLKAVLADRKVWVYCFFYCMMNISLSGFSSFLPPIVKSFGYSTLTTQLLTVPVYVATAISTLTMSIASDRLRKRGIFLMISFSVASLGWLLLLVNKSQGLSLAGCFLVGIGTFPPVVLIQSWQASNIIGYTRRAGALAFLMVLGQSFSVLEIEIFGDGPNYYPGKGLAFAGTAVAALVTPLFQLYLKRKNAQKLENQHTQEAAAKRALGIEEIGDDHPDFLYWL